MRTFFYIKAISFLLIVSIGTTMAQSNSKLSSGDWHKIGIKNDGVFKIDYTFINDKVGVNPSSIDFDEFGVFGQAMGILPESNATPRIDDIVEIPIKIVDNNNNNVWDSNDYILFYGKGPHLWHYNTANKVSHTYNIYTETANYFISTNSGTGKSLATINDPSTSSSTISSFDEILLYEEDVNNIIYSELTGGAGSGRVWYGKQFNNITTSQEFSFSIPDLIGSQPIQIKAVMGARAKGSSSNFTVTNNNSVIFTKNISAIGDGDFDDMANIESYEGEFSSSSTSLQFKVDFTSANSQAKGWLDYIELVAKRKINLNSSHLKFRAFESLNNPISKYLVSGSNSKTEIWDVSVPTEIAKVQGTLSGSNYEFTRESTELHEFVAINTSSNSFEVPEYVAEVDNQNLHNLSNTDYIIIAPEKFRDAANTLADFHRTNSNLKVTIVDPEKIYNEFSSGQQDLTAIRDFLKMFHDRNSPISDKLKYVLLFGDASFDYKDRIENNQNIIPTFQSDSHLTTVRSFCTDDYFGFLDDDEGLNIQNNTGDDLDIAIGRFPVNTEEEASDLVEKIIYYKSNPSSNGWKNELTFVADDEDNNLHFRDAEEILTISSIENFDYYNIDKIYLDSYSQINSAGGDRYPDVVDAILRKLFTGTFFVDYTGHGGPTNWAQERVFNIQDIKNLKNKDKLPLFMTATCDFSPFDDPTLISAGESLLLNPNGGAIAMLSTTRLVFSHSNKSMNKAVLNFLFQEVDGRMPTIGEILMQAKNTVSGNDNNRKFVLLGDPALTLEYPKHEVVTTKINGKTLLEIDTLKALSTVKIEGGIMDENGALLSDFNGIVYPTVFDKENTYRTQGNDEYLDDTIPKNSPREYKLRKNVIFKGKVSVKNGLFSFEFIVPKDINYSYGDGKITYYAEQSNDATVDAHGYTYNLKVGGSNKDFIPDDKGPDVEVFMNDSSFVFGGLTDENPVLLVSLKDKSGINTVGNGVGHDLTAILDENTQNQYLLNDYYESELDDFTRGKISFLLNNLTDGLHKISVKAWDVHNNPGEGYTEFLVASSALISLKNVLNYPNPFTTNTSFIFEHNRPDDDLMVTIQIYTMSGKIVKTIRQVVNSPSYRIHANEITWDGKDDYGDYIGRGVYLYKVNVQGSNGFNAYKFEKLVILK